ncbi:MAG: pyruvate dehydrogenase, partial [Myxococcales bacterium]|nr:pyruvate dehydrogenase [Myxococcales bacterium]
MTTEIKLPELGEGTESADVVRILVTRGERIEASQAILEVESDKATVEVPAGTAGVVSDVRVAVGDTVSVGQVVLVLEDRAPSESAESTASEGTEPKSETKAKPSGGESTEPAEADGRDGAKEGDGPRGRPSRRPSRFS